MGFEQVVFEAEDETRYYKWRSASVKLEPVAGTITIYTYPEITVPVSEIASCEIVEREDIRYFSLLDFLFTVLLVSESAFIEGMTAKKNTMVPVIKLTQSTSDDSGQGWVIHLRSRRRGQRGRVATFEMAHRIVAFLRQNGYSGPMPDLGRVVEASLKNKRRGIAFLIGGILAIVFAWAAGVFVGSYIMTGSFSWLAENFFTILDYASKGTRYGFCCTLPVLAFSLFALWYVVRKFIAGKQKRSNVISAIIVGVIIASVGGCFLAMFAVLEWYY